MTISPEYLAQQQKLHENPNYGVASLHYAPLVKDLAEQAKARSISDYGAGKCNLQKKLHELGKMDFDYFAYDPAFPEYGEPRKADLVCCIDVLEHIEMSFLDAVLDDLHRIVEKVGLFTIDTGPAIKTLPDGRNAHLIQKPTSWWLPRLCEHFEIIHLQGAPSGFWVIVGPKVAS
ncbi:MAG: hypothetical protein CMM52_03775 [Rhodospirillaceae bacterium]|nr:hypothetical protein [Rhodospirillaceae bacterium]|tara:strand:- start:2120 stop:2644 length:525 start_codon:yes stop_codon:yes gene_type:complete